MLTCVVGKNNINTFDFKDEKLREWSNKSMLKCPACGEKMLYCHGDFKIPYFRHDKNSSCPDIYSEGVTEEHIKGIKLLYEWLKTHEGVGDLQLEKWIPETRQRPDIYFKYNDEEYVIEYQCSPIATKYNERHDLYRLNNINDIWILGVNKYSIVNIDKERMISQNIKREVKTKTIEQQIFDENKNVIYLNHNNNRLYLTNLHYSNRATRERGWGYKSWTETLVSIINMQLFSYNLNDLQLNDLFETTFTISYDNYVNNIYIKDREYLINLLNNDTNIKILKCTGSKNLNITYETINNKVYNISYKYKTGEVTGFCNQEIVLNSERKGLIINGKFMDFKDIILHEDNIMSYITLSNNFKDMVYDYMKNRERELLDNQRKLFNRLKEQNKIDIFKNKNRKILDDKITIVDGRIKLDENIRFKFLKDFRFNEEYYLNEFANYVKDLSKFKSNEKYFMIPKSLCTNNSYQLERLMNSFIKVLKKYGFTNVRIYNKI